MHVYLIRHAHAEDGEPDAARPLSRKGRQQIRRMARLLREAKACDAGEFWHSPLVRAQDTAARFAQLLGRSATLAEVSGLKPDDGPEAAARKLNAARKPVAVVGHEPQLSALASLLVAGTSEPPRFRLKKCAVLRLDRSGDGWAVRWLLSPELA